MQVIRIALAVLLVFSLNACASTRNLWVKNTTQFLGGNFTVTLYSGGQPVRAWELRDGVVDEEAGSDGWNFACKTRLIRLSGDVVVEPTGEVPATEVPTIKCY